MSLRLTPKAHRKNKLVMRTKGTRKRRSVTGTDRLWLTAVSGEVVICRRFLYVNARWEQLGGPFPRKAQNRGFGGHVARGPSLSSDGGFRADVDDRASRLLERGQGMMSHRVVVH